jgi:proteasome lid subunit RPN8/RPN11
MRGHRFGDPAISIMDFLSFKREVSCFLVPGQRVISVTTNNSGGMVEFDFFTIWEALKTMDYKTVCMIHTHPSGFPVMSGTDWNMVYGWVQAIGKPILFVIITDSEITCYLCFRSPDNKNKVNRDIIKFKSNESFDSLCNVIYFLSSSDKVSEFTDDYMEEVLTVLNDNFSDSELEIFNDDKE